MKRWLLLLLTAAAVSTLFAGGLSPQLERLQTKYTYEEQKDLRSSDVLSVREINGEKRISVMVRAEDASIFDGRGIPYRHLSDDMYSAQVTIEDLEVMSLSDSVKKVDNIVKKRPHNDLSIPKINADDIHTAGYTGDDVLIGIVDSGIDVDHAAFQDASGNTRILYIWDQTTGSNSISVGSFSASYGTEWTAAQIDAGTCTEADYHGHGTHVAGSVGGYDTSYTARKGSATTSNIIFVKTDFMHVNDAVDYINERAKAIGKPVIVNMSLGSQWGPHDGTDTETAALDSMIAASNGDLMVVRSAGNDANDACHGYLDSITTSAQTLDFDIDGTYYSTTSGANNDYLYINFYYDSTSTLDIRVTDSTGTATSWITASSYDGTLSDGTGITVWKGAHDGDTKHIQVMLGDYGKTQSEYPRSGTQWKFEFKAQSGTVTRLDGWIYSGLENGYPGTMLFNVADTTTMSLGNGACGNNVIAVAAYTIRSPWVAKDGTWTYGHTADAITPFSSQGPTRDGRNKPDVTGPGSMILSARSSDEASVTGDSYLPNDPISSSSITYRYMQGTSMSSPIVAGGVALIKEINSSWTYSDVINYFKTNSQGTSQYTWSSNSWDSSWGWGVLDLTNALGLDDFSITAPETGSIYKASTGTIGFTWGSAGSSVSYVLQYSMDPTFASNMSVGVGSNTFYNVAVPAAVGTYYARVYGTKGGVTKYSSNTITFNVTALDVPGAFEPVNVDDTSAEERLYLLSQATDAGNVIEFSWADTNNVSNVTYEGLVYLYGTTPGAGIAKPVTTSAGTYTMALTVPEANITQEGHYVFRLKIINNSDTSDTLTVEQDLYVRSLDAELLPNLLNDDYVKVGVVGQEMQADEKASDNFVLMKYTTTSGSTGWAGMEANGTGAYSSWYTFNNTAFTGSLTVDIGIGTSPYIVDAGIQLTRSAASPATEPDALHSSIELEGQDAFTYINVNHPDMHGIDDSDGPIFYIAHVDEGIPYASETHKLAVWRNGSWSDTDRISQSGYYTVLPGKIPVMTFSNGDLFNSPNPFNPTTTVNYSAGEAGHARLIIFDSRGREVRLLLDGNIAQPGDYSAFWDGRDNKGRDVASGVYYAVLEINGRRYTHKMVMLK